MDKKIIGLNIKEKRKKKELTQEKLADMTGLSRNYISDIENGRYTPSVESISKIAHCLDLNLNFLSEMTEIQVK